MNEKRIDSIQALRGIACLGVMFMHTYVIKRGGDWNLGRFGIFNFIRLFDDEAIL